MNHAFLILCLAFMAAVDYAEWRKKRRKLDLLCVWLAFLAAACFGYAWWQA